VTAPIYHLAVAAEWVASEGEYRRSTLGQSLDEVGYVHCATAAQVQGVADLFYRGRDDVVLLTIDPERVGAPVRYEEVGGEKFPHVYGPVPIKAVVSVTPLRPDLDGRLVLGGAL
jgi:glutathione S-transferase